MNINQSGGGGSCVGCQYLLDEGIIVDYLGFNLFEFVPNFSNTAEIGNSKLLPHQLEYDPGESVLMGIILVMGGIYLYVELFGHLQDLALSRSWHCTSVGLHHSATSWTQLLQFGGTGYVDD